MKFRYAKETKETTIFEVAHIQDQVAKLKPTDIQLGEGRNC